MSITFEAPQRSWTKPVPMGWYSAGYSHEFETGQVAERRFVGRDLVVWREADGTPHVVDAYCPHLGAHLGLRGMRRGRPHRLPVPPLGIRRRGHQRRHPLRRTHQRQGAAAHLPDRRAQPHGDVLVPPGPVGRTVVRGARARGARRFDRRVGVRRHRRDRGRDGVAGDRRERRRRRPLPVRARHRVTRHRGVRRLLRASFATRRST